MKNKILTGLTMLGFSLLACSAIAATTISVLPTAPTYVFNSIYGNTNNAPWGTNPPTGLWPTNGLYPNFIAGGTTTITNPIPLVSLNGMSGNSLSLELIGATTGTAGAAGNSSNTITYTVMASTTTPSIVTTNATGFYAVSANTPMQPYGTFTLALGNTAGTIAMTNILLTPYSTPAFAGPLKLYLTSIATLGMTNVCEVTNYAALVTQGP